MEKGLGILDDGIQRKQRITSMISKRAGNTANEVMNAQDKYKKTGSLQHLAELNASNFKKQIKN